MPGDSGDGDLPDRGVFASWSTPPPDPRVTFKLRKVGRATARELVRSMITILSLLLIMGTVYLSYRASQHDHWDGAKDWLSAVLPAETGILGSALGFYFGSDSKEKK